MCDTEDGEEDDEPSSLIPYSRQCTEDPYGRPMIKPGRINTDMAPDMTSDSSRDINRESTSHRDSDDRIPFGIQCSEDPDGNILGQPP